MFSAPYSSGCTEQLCDSATKRWHLNAFLESLPYDALFNKRWTSRPSPDHLWIFFWVLFWTGHNLWWSWIWLTLIISVYGRFCCISALLGFWIPLKFKLNFKLNFTVWIIATDTLGWQEEEINLPLMQLVAWPDPDQIFKLSACSKVVLKLRKSNK